jgi:hypothetical protein
MPKARQSRISAAVVTRTSRTKVYKHAKLKEDACQLLAEDRLPDEEIAGKLKISRTTLANWKRDPKFADRVNAITAAHAERALKFGLARRERRLRVLNQMHDKILDVIDERAADPKMQTVPGGKTGIVTRMVKSVGHGDNFQLVDVYEIDVPALKEIRAIQEQVVDELGQRISRRIGEYIQPVNATQVNVNVNQEERQPQASIATPEEKRKLLVQRMREAYGLGPIRDIGRQSVAIADDPKPISAADSGSATTGLTGRDSDPAVPLS